MELEFIGEGFTDQFGNKIVKGIGYPISFNKFIKPLNWNVNWFSYAENVDPIKDYTNWESVIKQSSPNHSITTDHIGFRWWGSPADGLDPDRFATIAAERDECAAS